MGVPESRPFRFSTLLSVFERNSSLEASNNLSILPPGIGPGTDESAALAPLKDLIEVGDRPLDSILRTIADSAGRLTGASGVALAMWKDGAMVCRARSGDAAPPLGSELTASAGISGECLSTGKIQHCADTENDALVDMDVCRSFGLRSIAALPIVAGGGLMEFLKSFLPGPKPLANSTSSFSRNSQHSRNEPAPCNRKTHRLPRSKRLAEKLAAQSDAIPIRR